VTREDLAEMMVGREVLMEPATTPQSRATASLR